MTVNVRLRGDGFQARTLTWDLFLDGETDFYSTLVFSAYFETYTASLRVLVASDLQSQQYWGESGGVLPALKLPAPSVTGTLCFFFRETERGLDAF